MEEVGHDYGSEKITLALMYDPVAHYHYVCFTGTEKKRLGMCEGGAG